MSSPKPKESEPEQTKEPPLESEEDVEVSVLIPPEETPEPEQKKEEKEKGKGINWLFLAGGAAVVLLGGVAAGSVAVLSRKPKAPRGSGRRGAGKRR